MHTHPLTYSVVSSVSPCLLCAKHCPERHTFITSNPYYEPCKMSGFISISILLFLFLFFFLRYAGLSLLWPLPLRSTGSGRAGSAAMAHGPSRSAACGIFPDRGTNPCPLHRQADSQPLCHQGSPYCPFYRWIHLGGKKCGHLSCTVIHMASEEWLNPG